MLQNKGTQQLSAPGESDTYTFKREDDRWYIHWPDYAAQERRKPDLPMIEGAHKFLNVLSKGAYKLRLRISTQLHNGWDTLEVIEHCPSPKGGAMYLFTPSAKEAKKAVFWICDLTLFIFGDMPDNFYVQRLSGKK